MSTRIEKGKKTDILYAEPKMYAVMMHNDDYTPMEFVVKILEKIFHKEAQAAEAIMLNVHREGIGVAGVYSFDIAVTKKLQAEQLANEKGYPLKLTLTEVGHREI